MSTRILKVHIQLPDDHEYADLEQELTWMICDVPQFWAKACKNLDLYSHRITQISGFVHDAEGNVVGGYEVENE